MQTWNTFIRRHPRLQLQSYLNRRGLKTVEAAAQHFRNANVEPDLEALRAVLEPSKAPSKAPSAVSEPVEPASTEEEAGPAETSATEEETASVTPARRRSTRRKKTTASEAE